MEIPGPVLLDRESEARSSGPRSRFGDVERGLADEPEGPSGFCVTRLFVSERKGPQSFLLHWGKGRPLVLGTSFGQNRTGFIRKGLKALLPRHGDSHLYPRARRCGRW